MAEMLPIFRMFAGYNAWANERLYSAAAMLSDSEYRADHGAFFGSVHGTLNHLVVGDRIWMQRLTGEGEAPARLDAFFMKTSARYVRRERPRTRASSLLWRGSASTTSAVGVRYRTISRPADIEQELGYALPHVFNHQTHHRGQVHCLLTKTVEEAPSLDLILYQRETGLGLS
jgi:uncharacterized damage-inducible protein DinB